MGDLLEQGQLTYGYTIEEYDLPLPININCNFKGNTNISFSGKGGEGLMSPCPTVNGMLMGGSLVIAATAAVSSWAHNMPLIQS